MGSKFFEGLKGVPVTPAKPIDVELTNMIGAEKPKKSRAKLGSAAFNHYRDQGDGRTLHATAVAFGVSDSAVCKFAKRHSWDLRIANESPQRAAEVSQAVAVRMKDKLPALLSASTADADAEQARRVKDELLRVGAELVTLGQQYLKAVPLSEPQHVLKAIDLGSKLMLSAVESKDAKDGQTLIEMMKARLARLQAETPPVVTVKPAAPVKGLDDDE